MLNTILFSKLLYHVIILRNLCSNLRKRIILIYLDILYNNICVGEVLLQAKLNISLGLLFFRREIWYEYD